MIRTVIVETKNGPLTRSVPGLHDLEFMCDLPEEPQSPSVSMSEGPLPSTTIISNPATSVSNQNAGYQNIVTIQNETLTQNDYAKIPTRRSSRAKTKTKRLIEES